MTTESDKPKTIFLPYKEYTAEDIYTSVGSIDLLGSNVGPTAYLPNLFELDTKQKIEALNKFLGQVGLEDYGVELKPATCNYYTVLMYREVSGTVLYMVYPELPGCFCTYISDIDWTEKATGLIKSHFRESISNQEKLMLPDTSLRKVQEYKTTVGQERIYTGEARIGVPTNFSEARFEEWLHNKDINYFDVD